MSEPVRSEPVQSKPVHPVDEILPLPKLFALGLQHVLVMYANAVAVPLIIGGALHLPKDQMAMLINADLFACGIATLIQTVGFGPFGIRLPIIMGVTAVSISPMLAMAAMPGVGLTPSWSAAYSASASRRSSNTCCASSRRW
jgi:uric acid transporter